jgi:hypothetical protein
MVIDEAPVKLAEPHVAREENSPSESSSFLVGKVGCGAASPNGLPQFSQKSSPSRFCSPQ